LQKARYKLAPGFCHKKIALRVRFRRLFCKLVWRLGAPCAPHTFAALRRTALVESFIRVRPDVPLHRVLSLHDNFGAAFQISKFILLNTITPVVARKHLSGNENSCGYIS